MLVWSLDGRCSGVDSRGLVSGWSDRTPYEWALLAIEGLLKSRDAIGVELYAAWQGHDSEYVDTALQEMGLVRTGLDWVVAREMMRALPSIVWNPILLEDALFSTRG